MGACLDRLLPDAGLRAEAQQAAGAWMAGKPEKSVSEFKMFGD